MCVYNVCVKCVCTVCVYSACVQCVCVQCVYSACVLYVYSVCVCTVCVCTVRVYDDVCVLQMFAVQGNAAATQPSVNATKSLLTGLQPLSYIILIIISVLPSSRSMAHGLYSVPFHFPHSLHLPGCCMGPRRDIIK